MSNSAPRRKPTGTTYNLLFVCTGNTCRSPLAEAIARELATERGWTHVAVRSAGVSAVRGSEASQQALVVAREQGLDLATHESQPVTPELLDWADLVLSMGPSHMFVLAEFGAADKSALVTAFLDGDAANRPVSDPFGSDLAAYRRTFAQLRTAIEALLDRLEPILAP
jgi:protein-tyrosine phosphatase